MGNYHGTPSSFLHPLMRFLPARHSGTRVPAPCSTPGNTHKAIWAAWELTSGQAARPSTWVIKPPVLDGNGQAHKPTGDLTESQQESQDAGYQDSRILLGSSTQIKPPK